MPARRRWTRRWRRYGGFDHNAQTLRIVTRLERRYAELRRAEPDLGDAGGRGQAQRPAAPRAGCRRCVAEYSRWRTISSSTRTPAPRRRSRRSPTTSPTTTTTSTTACAPGCSRSTTRGAAAGRRRVSPRSTARYPGPRAAAADPRDHAPPDRRAWSRPGRGDARAGSRRCAPAGRPTPCAPLHAPVVGFSPDGRRAAARACASFLHERMYRHYKVNRMTLKARRVVRELFESCSSSPTACRRTGWRERAGAPATRGTAAADRRLHRRHDRPLRARRARPAVQAAPGRRR